MFSTPRRRAIGWALIWFGVVGFVLLAATTIVIQYQMMTEILSCTQPKGECNQRGQRQTSGAIDDINKITVYAAACADRPYTQTEAQIYACVMQKLARDAEQAP